MTHIFGADLPTWLVVLTGSLFLGVLYSEVPSVGGPLILLVVLLIVISLVQQGKVRT